MNKVQLTGAPSTHGTDTGGSLLGTMIAEWPCTKTKTDMHGWVAVTSSSCSPACLLRQKGRAHIQRNPKVQSLICLAEQADAQISGHRASDAYPSPVLVPAVHRMHMDEMHERWYALETVVHMCLPDIGLSGCMHVNH